MWTYPGCLVTRLAFAHNIVRSDLARLLRLLYLLLQLCLILKTCLLGVILLLGYGLVNIPRTLWREADAGTCFKRSLHR